MNIVICGCRSLRSLGVVVVPPKLIATLLSSLLSGCYGQHLPLTKNVSF